MKLGWMKCSFWEGCENKRKRIDTAQGCKHCEIEADDEARWCIYPGGNPGRRREIQPRNDSRKWHGVKWRWITNDSQSVGLDATAFRELEKKKKKKKFIATNIRFTTLFQAASAYYSRCIFFLQFPKLNVQLMFWYTPFIYIYNIYINLCMYTHIYICMYGAYVYTYIYISIVYV